MKNYPISYDQYHKIRDKSINKTYYEKYKEIRLGIYVFSFFGNIASVFLAYFFFRNIFDNAFNELSNNIFITIGIIFFLGLFELIKRYVFDLFSIEYIKNNKTLLKKNMIGFIFCTLLIVCTSCYFTISGAKKFTDKEISLEDKTEINITSKTDSINNLFFTEYIKPLKEQNKSLLEQNEKLNLSLNNAISLDNKNNVYSTRTLINQNVKMVNKNDTLINKYEKERDFKISEFKLKQNNNLIVNKDRNKQNILIFILISTIIELIIMIGIYYNEFYLYKVTTEYEKDIMNTPLFRLWKKYDEILEIIFGTGININEQMMPEESLASLLLTNEVNISKKEIKNFFRLAYNLKIIVRQGPKRIINQSLDDSKDTLKNHFKIK